MAVNEERLNHLLGQFVSDLGAAVATATVVIGDRLGLYRGLAAIGPATAAELAAHTDTHERYVREWLRGQAAGATVTYDAAADRYHLTPEQSFAFADPDGLALPGAFQLAAACVKDEETVSAAFRTGGGVGWHEHHHDVFTGTERFFRPGYVANLVPAWIPALDGLAERLGRGDIVAPGRCRRRFRAGPGGPCRARRCRCR
jgi:hypothetical protein